MTLFTLLALWSASSPLLQPFEIEAPPNDCRTVLATGLLAGTLGLLAAGCASRSTQDRTLAGAGRIETVTGPVAVDSLGVTLMHEHILVDSSAPLW